MKKNVWIAGMTAILSADLFGFCLGFQHRQMNAPDGVLLIRSFRTYGR